MKPAPEPDYSQPNQQYTTRGHMYKHQNQTTASPTSNTQHVDTWTNITTRLQPAQPAIHNTWTHEQTSEPDYSQPNQQYTTRGHMYKHQNQTTASSTSNTQHVDTWTNIRTRLQPAQPAIHNTWTHEQTSEPDYSQPNQQYTTRGHMYKHQNQTTASPTSNTQHVDTWTNIRTRLQPAQPAIHNTWTHVQTSEPDYSQPNQQYTRRGHMNKHHNQTTASPTSNTQRVDTCTNIRTRLQPAQPAIHNAWTHEQTSEPDYSQPNQQYTRRGHMNKHQNQTTASPTSNTQHVDTWTNIRTRLQPAQPAIHNTWTHEQTSEPDYSQPNQQYTRRGHMNKHHNQTTASPTSNTQDVDTWTNMDTYTTRGTWPNIRTRLQPAQPAIHNTWTHEQTSEPDYSQPNQQYTTRGHMNKHQNQTTASPTSNTQHVDTWTNITTRLQSAQPAIHKAWTHEQTSEPDYSQLNQQYTTRGHMNKHQNQTTASPTSNTQHVDTWTNIRTRLQPAQPAIHNTWTHEQTSEPDYSQPNQQYTSTWTHEQTSQPDYSQPNQQYTTRGHMNKHHNQTTASPTSNTQGVEQTSEPDYSQPNQQYTTRGHMNKHQNQTTASPTSNTQHVDTWTNITTRLQSAQPAIHKAWTHEQTSEPDYSQPNQQYTTRGHMNKHQNQTTASPTSNTQHVDTWTNITTRLQPAQPAIHKAWTREQTSEPDYSQPNQQYTRRGHMNKHHNQSYSQPNQQYTRRGHMNKHQNQTTASPTSNTQHVDTWTNITTRLQPAQPAIHNTWTHEQTSEPDYSQLNQQYTRRGHMNKHQNQTTASPTSNTQHVDTWTNIRDYSQPNQQYTTRGHINKHQNQTTASPTSNTQGVDTWTNIRTRLQPAQPAIHNTWTHEQTSEPDYSQPNQQYTTRGHINKHQNQTTASPTSNTQGVDTWTNIRTRLQPAQPAIHNTWTHEQTSEPDYSQLNQQYTTRGHMKKHQEPVSCNGVSHTYERSAGLC